MSEYQNNTAIPSISDQKVTASNEPSNIIRLITDEPAEDAPDFQKYAIQLSRIIANTVPRFTIGIYGGWGTGKTSLMRMIEKELKQTYSKNIEAIWFDSWRYEREDYSAMVPLLRTIISHLENASRKTDSYKQKIETLQRVQKRFRKMLLWC